MKDDRVRPDNAAPSGPGGLGGTAFQRSDNESSVKSPLAADVFASKPPVRLFLMVNTLETGGSERQYTVLAQNLIASQFDIHLGCVSRRGPLAHNFPDAAQFPLGGSLFGWRSLKTRLKLCRHLRERKVQVAHAFDFYANLTMIPAAKLARVPLVIGSHRQLGDLMTSSQFRAQTQAFRWCDAVVCNSQAAADRLISAGLDRDKIAIIGNALPAEVFITVPAGLPKASGVIRVGMVARMNHRYKNHSGFLRIAAQIRRQLPNTEFVLVGDGPLREELEREASSLGLGGSVIFLGDRQDMPPVLASIDVAVNTSDSESLSNVILEAMAAGLPTVAYNVGGNSELIGGAAAGSERGFLIPAGDETAFAQAVTTLLSDGVLRHRQGSNARQFAQEKFSLNRVLQGYADLYRKLLARKLGSDSAA